MLKQTSREFRKLFLLKFTKTLIDAHAPEDIAKLERIVKQEEKEGTPIQQESKQLEKNIIDEKVKRLKTLKKERGNIKPRSLNLKESLKSLRRIRPVLRIPETKLPPTFQYLRPIPTNAQIDLGRLNIFTQDPLVNIIECNGPNANIIVHGKMGRKPTKMVLTKEEIDQVIKRFSETAKIPVDEGVFKAVVGKLILSAMVSETVGSKFVIRKMRYSPKYY